MATSITVADLFRKNARGEITCQELVKILIGDKKRGKRPSSASKGSRKRESTTNRDDGTAKEGHEDTQDNVAQGEKLIESSNHLQNSHHHHAEGGGDINGAGTENEAELWGESSSHSHTSEKIKEDAIPDDDTFRDMRGLDVAFPEAGKFCFV
jgi:hypothetical protein